MPSPVALIGMSNIGKSRGARQLTAHGYRRISCDALIEAKLAPELATAGLHGLRDVARWMGQPYEAGYRETSARYLACENDVMRDIVANLSEAASPAVIDTTGSVVHLDDAILRTLRDKATFVYLEASQAHTDDLFRRYLANPKPVIWGDAWAPRPHETARQSLERCYPDLLAARAARYAALAHVTIPYDRHRRRDADLASLIQEQTT